MTAGAARRDRAQGQYEYLEYDRADGYGGGASRLGLVLEGRLWQQRHCRPDEVCPITDRPGSRAAISAAA